MVRCPECFGKLSLVKVFSDCKELVECQVCGRFFELTLSPCGTGVYRPVLIEVDLDKEECPDEEIFKNL